MAISETLSDNKTLGLPYASNVAINKGDLLYWDATNYVVKPLTSWTTGASETVDQANVTKLFAGVAGDTQLSTESNKVMTVVTDGIFDVDCVSGIYYPGDIVGVTWAGGTSLQNQYVAKITAPTSANLNGYLAIGLVVDPYGKKYSNFAGGTGLVATTRIRVKFTSRLFWSHSFTRSGYGSSQGVGSKTLPGGANYQVLVTDPPILTMVPTAARTITLPLETISNGLQFTFVNQAATALNITLAGSGASLVGTATVGQGKTALVQCDGTNWYSVVSA